MEAPKTAILVFFFMSNIKKFESAKKEKKPRLPDFITQNNWCYFLIYP